MSCSVDRLQLSGVVQGEFIPKSADLPLQNTFQEQHFSCEDITFLATRCFGLRHVSGIRAALDEGLDGFKLGCSLSLAPHQARLTHMQEKSWSMVKLNEGERQEFVGHFERGVDDFIEGSLKYDLMHSPNKPIMGEDGKRRSIKTVGDLVDYLRDRCGLSIVNYGCDLRAEWQSDAKQARDWSSWGQGLGRFEKMSMRGGCIQILPMLLRSDMGYSPEEFDRVITTEGPPFDKDVCIRMTACYRAALIERIRMIRDNKRYDNWSERPQFAA